MRLSFLIMSITVLTLGGVDDMKSAVLFVLAVVVISITKTTLLTLSTNTSNQEHVLARDGGEKAYLYPSIPGTDIPTPFSTRISTQSRTIGLSRLYYAVVSGTSIRDARFKSFLR